MTDYKKAFVDTAPFVYFIEKDENNPQYYEKAKKFFSNGYEADKKFVTSVITMHLDMIMKPILPILQNRKNIRGSGVHCLPMKILHVYLLMAS